MATVGGLPIFEKNKIPPNEPRFNVKHYERAILSASDITYRDMAIQAASKDLTEEAMAETHRRYLSRLSQNFKRVDGANARLPFMSGEVSLLSWMTKSVFMRTSCLLMAWHQRGGG